MGETVLDVIFSHASVRSYTSEPVSREDLERILEAARRAPTAWNLMPVYIYAVLDEKLKGELAEALGGQEHVARAPVFLVFSLDWGKLLKASEESGVEPAIPGIGHIVPGLVDVGIIAGWAGLAAESLGYGITFIAVYSNPCRVAEILGLEEYVVPVVGIALGRPAESPGPRPRQDPVSVYGIDVWYRLSRPC